MKPRNRFIHWMHLAVLSSLLLAITGIYRPALAQSSCGATYTVKSGDTLSSIAVLCGVTLTALEQANTQVSTPDLIFPNQVITLPTGVIPVTGGQALVGLSPASGAAGAQVKVVGSGFPANAALQLTVGQQGVSPMSTSNVTTDNSGAFSTQVSIPTSAAQGSAWQVTAASGTSGGPSATSQFQVFATPPSGTYTVKSGDTLLGIAARFNTTVDALTRANPQNANINLLTVGETLNIPGSITTINGQTVYIVKNGDFMSSIAVAQGVNLAALEQANPGITDPTLIFPGQQVIIPGGVIPVTGGGQALVSLNPATGNAGSQVTVSGSGFTANTALNISVAQGSTTSATVPVTSDNNGAFSVAVTIPSSAGSGSVWTISAAPQAGGGSLATATFQVFAQAPAGFYKVVTGDTLGSIASQFNTTVDTLVRANPNLTSASTLSVGQQLFVPGSLVTANGQTVYVVRAGDYLSLIAVNRGVTLAALEQANPQITDPSLVFPGDHVIIP
jgi:LysM repeat protein